METKLDHKGKYLMAQGLSGWAGCSWRQTIFSKTCQGSNKRKQRVWYMMKSDRPLTARLIADPLNRSHKAVHKILTEHFGMREVCKHLASTSWRHNVTKHCLRGSFWHPRTLQWFLAPIFSRCSQVTSFSSQGLSTTYEYITSLQSTASRQSWSMHWRTSQKKTSAMFPGVEGPPSAMCCFWRGPCWNCSNDFFL